MNLQVKSAAEVVISTALILIILSLIYAPLSIGGIPFIGPGSWKLGTAILFGVVSWSFIPFFFGGGRIALKPEPLSFLIGFLLLIFSNYPSRNFGYFAHPFSVSVLTILLLLAGIGYYCFKKLERCALVGIAIFAVSFVALVFAREVSGRLIFSDDHASFLYRLYLLGDQFPKIPFYNPQWNAGYSAREFFATGCLNIYLLLLPFIKFGALNNPFNYSLLIGIIPFVVFPLSIYVAQKTLRTGIVATTVSVVLCLAPSLDFFEWFLTYGTLGFVCSLVIVPLVLALSYRLILGEEQLGRKGILALLISATLCFFWTLSVAVFVPLALYSLIYSCRNFSKTRVISTAVFVLLFLAFNGLWLKTFITESKVAGFVSTAQLPGTAKRAPPSVKIVLIKAEKKFVELTSKLNPALLLLGLPGLFLFRERRLKNLMLLTVVWLFLLAAFGDSIKPQLELRRMSLIAAVLLILPASLSVEYLFAKLKEVQLNNFIRQALTVGLLFTLLIVPINAGAIYSNQSDIKFQYASDVVLRLSEILKNDNSGGRAFFFGFILHELGESGPGHQDGGHVAPLALWTHRELYASHYFHARWSSVDPIPPSFREKGKAGVEEFLDLMNVTEVVALRKEWLKYCQDDPTYQLRDSVGRFHIFTRTAYHATPIIEGDAEIISAVPGELQIKPKSQKVVLKYRFLPLLKSSSPAVKVSGRDLFDELVAPNQTESFQAIELEIKQSFIDSGGVVTLSF